MRRTEERNPSSKGMDKRPIEEILHIINAEDGKVTGAVAEVIPSITTGVEAIVETIRGGGTIFFAGAGTSGRLGVLEAAELPPTFGVSSDLFRAIIAGGPGAVFGSIEAAEDDERLGEKALEENGFEGKDLLVALSGSGGTPYALGALRKARETGGKTITITCNPGSPMEGLADMAIVVETGAEVVSGSTRMKAGTAQKMVLNMLTTAAMTKLGYVHDGYMISVQPTSNKLRERAARIVAEITGVKPGKASETLEKAGWDLKVAVLILKGGMTVREARSRLSEAGGILRRALEGIR
ncbi:MAG: N-acetylmuramic acid 6-phosphate etherase [Candidatus Bathyarchaeota archaeon]|jgi:N-acetylmuramic acid 6-phosphate etherase